MFIPHSRPHLGDEEIAAVAAVINSRYLAAGGPEAQGLERDLGALCGREVVAVSSGTTALQLALLALGIGDRTTVIVPSLACTSLLHAVHAAGATPVLCDVDENAQISLATVKRAITTTTSAQAIIAPHLFGKMAPIRELMSLGIPVVEDCAQCIGGISDGKTAGSLGTVSIFSFHATKMLCAGEGGAVASNDVAFLKRCRTLLTYDQQELYSLAYNWRMPELSAAVCRIQLSRLPRFLERRMLLAQSYLQALSSGTKVRPLYAEIGPDNIFFRFCVLAQSKEHRRSLQNNFKQQGIAAEQPIFRPLHHYTGEIGFSRADFFYERMLSIPLYPDLQDVEAAHITRSLQLLQDKL